MSHQKKQWTDFETINNGISSDEDTHPWVDRGIINSSKDTIKESETEFELGVKTEAKVGLKTKEAEKLQPETELKEHDNPFDGETEEFT